MNLFSKDMEVSKYGICFCNKFFLEPLTGCMIKINVVTEGYSKTSLFKIRRRSFKILGTVTSFFNGH